jgi:hypothetical protein
MLTSARLSELFDTPVVVDVVDDYAYVRPGVAAAAGAGVAAPESRAPSPEQGLVT